MKKKNIFTFVVDVFVPALVIMLAIVAVYKAVTFIQEMARPLAKVIFA